MKTTIILPLLLVAACDKSKPSTPAPAAKPVAEVSAPAATAVNLGKLGTLRLGMKASEVRTALGIATDQDLDGASVTLDDATYEVSIEKETLESFSVSYKADPSATLAATWGAGLQGTIEGTSVTSTCWFDTATKIRSCLSKSEGTFDLAVSPYMPLASLLGPDDAIGFAPDGVIGLPISAVRAQAGTELDVDDVAGIAKVVYPPTEWAESKTEVEFIEGENTVGMISTRIYPGPQRTEVLALLERKWGAPTPGDNGQKRFRSKARDTEVVVSEDDGHIELSVN